MTKYSNAAKYFISIALLFHLIGALVTPNASSYLRAELAPIYRPYMNFLGLSHTWGFFAPEPISPPLYIDYVLEQKGGQNISGRFPAVKNPYFFRDRHNRRMSLSKYIVSSDDNIRNMFMNYLCHKYPLTTEAKLWRVVGTQPSLEMVQKGEKKITDTVDYKIEILGTYYCQEMQDKDHG